MDTDKVMPSLSTSAPTANDDDKLSEKLPLLPAASREMKRASSRWITVEPIIFTMSIASGIFLTVQPQFIKQRLADDRNFNYSLDENSENGTCSSVNSSDPNYITELEILADTSYWQMIILICGYFPALFTSPLIGAWGDKAGRKVSLGLPITGFIIVSITYLLVYYFVLPIWVFTLGYLVLGITGNYGLLLASSYAYVADVTTKDKRMMRIVTVQAVFVLGMGICQIVVGYVIKATGFGPALWMALICLLGSLCYIIVPSCLIETIQTKNSFYIFKVLDRSRVTSAYQLFAMNTDYRRVKLILLLLIAFTTELFSQASLNVTVIYGLGPPFCWSSVLVGIYSAVVLFTSAGAMIGARGLAVCLSDTWIMQVGMIFGVANGLLNAFAINSVELFLVAVLTCIRAVEQPMFHLMLSKLVDSNEQGVMFATESSVLNLASFFSPLFLNTTYSATVDTQPNFVFLMMAGTRIVPISLIATLQLIIRCTRPSNLAVPKETSMDEVKEHSKEP